VNVVDSSGWLEYFAEGINADFFAPAIEDIDQLIVPTLSIFEVFKKVLGQRSESEALQAAALMQQGKVIDLGTTIALHAAKLSLDLKLPLADSVMLASAQDEEATLWTQDADFKDIPGVKYIEKRGD
jgi:predicted nucleic acid-binding protein